MRAMCLADAMDFGILRMIVDETYRTMTVLKSLDYVCKITDVLARAIPALGQKLRGFDSPDAVLTGPETRSSSPVRVVRGEDLCSTGLAGLYPCGEGAGYAGGITSAAMDGLRVAEQIIAKYALPAEV